MRIATWNINGLRARLDRVLAWVDAEAPDVLLLQETKVPDAAFPELPFAERGLGVAFSAPPVGARNGVAIVSRGPIADVHAGLPGDADDELADDMVGRTLFATTLGLRVCCAYAPNGRTVDSPFMAAKLRWFERLTEALAGELDTDAGAALLLAGDLNVAPEDRDAWDPADPGLGTHVGPPIREAWARLAELGLVDTLRAAHPDAEQGPFSWWDYRAGAFHKGMGLRIDHVLASPALRERLAGARVDRNARKGPKPSDHAPVVVDFADAAA